LLPKRIYKCGLYKWYEKGWGRNKSKNTIVMKYLSFFTILLMSLASCKESTKVASKPLETNLEISSSDQEKVHPGKKIMETECYLCHNPKASEVSMIAPPMVAIKKHYIDSTTTKEQFIKAMVDWINDPKEEKSKMPDALDRFGIMPYQPYPEETINLIAEYMYDYEIAQPEWFDEHFQREHGKRTGNVMGYKKGIQTDYGDIGLGYALATKAALGKNLMKAIQEKGTDGAVAFCNLRAIELTDSISVMNNAQIKRVSDKPRNPFNKANKEELGYITTFKEQLAAGMEVDPVVVPGNEEVTVYYPITTNAMCLQCHGKPNEQVKPTTMATLRKLYPEDKAVGYNVNEVRGIWSVVFDKNK
jgi:nitrate reductase cytochrome c-type subunit